MANDSDLSKLNEKKLLRLQALVIGELKRRKIVLTKHNPVRHPKRSLYV